MDRAMPLNVLQETTEPPHEKRGVENPRVVDLILPDPERGEVVLKILEPRPWGSDPRQLHQLEDKLNAYFGYVLDGFLVEQYPQYEGVNVRIQLECAEPPGDFEREFLDAAMFFSARHDVRLVVRVVDDPLGPPPPWEQGEQQGERGGG